MRYCRFSTEYISEGVLKIRQYLLKLERTTKWDVFFETQCRYIQTESTTKNSRLLAGAESTESTTKNSRLLAGAESIKVPYPILSVDGTPNAGP